MDRSFRKMVMVHFCAGVSVGAFHTDCIKPNMYKYRVNSSKQIFSWKVLAWGLSQQNTVSFECLRPESTDGAEMQYMTGLWYFLGGEYLQNLYAKSGFSKSSASCWCLCFQK